MLIEFPNLPTRAWLIEPAEGGQFVGRFIGPGFKDPDRTQAGTMKLVMDALKHPANRCGLPILVHRDCNRRSAA